MNQNDGLKLVAEYDGWKYTASGWCKPTILDDREYFHLAHAITTPPVEYCTSFDTLIPVIKKVAKDMIFIPGTLADIAWNDIIEANNSFDISALFPAVVSAIELINKYKK